MKKDWIYNLPKVELHCHLDGSLPLETVRTLAKLSEISIPENEEELKQELEVSKSCNSLAEYLEKFDLPLACLQTEECLKFAAYSLIREVAKEHVIYIEVRFAPLSCTNKGLCVKQIIKSVIEGLHQGFLEFGVRSGVLLCGMRHHSVEKNISLLQDAREFLGKGVCGVDLAGSEADFPPMMQKEFFEEANNLGFPITIHAGECQSAENVHDAIYLGAKRIGHGIAIINDEKIQKEVKIKNIGLEMCPSSNLQTKAVSDIKEYPIRKFMERGLQITLNTDNRTVTGTTLSKEYKFMQEEFNLSEEELVKITQDAINLAFVEEKEKEALLKQVKDFINKYE